MNTTDFVARHGITATHKLVPENPNMSDMPAGSAHFKVTLHYQGRVLTTPFSMGPALKPPPDAASVLDCLASDAGSIVNARSFEEWAGDLGYDTDSRKAEKIWRTCRRLEMSLRRFIGDDALFQELLFKVERL